MKIEFKIDWRALAKTVTWRMTATTAIIVIAWYMTGSIELGLSLGGVEMLIKLPLYYLHERLWKRVKIVGTDME